MLELPGQPPIYIIIDALDECPKTSGVVSPREQVISLVEGFIELHLPNLRLCIASRPEADVRAALGPLASHLVSRLFQCLAVSVRPLRVEELAEIIAIRFEEGALPEYNMDRYLEDSEEAVLTGCSSLITIVDVDGSLVVQFSHFSVKEFLTSDRVTALRKPFPLLHCSADYTYDTSEGFREHPTPTR